jgi:LuxR family maltose regulon positive regulatory protein
MGAEALALIALGDRQQANAVMTEGVAMSEALEARPFTTFGLACRAMLAIDQEEWEAAEKLNGRALELIGSVGLDRYVTSALPYSLAARFAVMRGEIEQARSLTGKAAALRPRLTSALPILSLVTLLEMARTFIELSDVAGARRVMREASDVLAVRPRLGTLVPDHDRLKTRLATLPAGSVGPSSLTRAELRLLPLLVTHLTYPEIGERLFISRHTVKTQAMSIYRKLGVSSRTDAVEKARAIGLLGV